MFYGGHDVAPDFWGVEDVGTAAVEGADDVGGDEFGIGKAASIRKMVAVSGKQPLTVKFGSHPGSAPISSVKWVVKSFIIQQISRNRA